MTKVGVSASASVFAVNIQDWFPLGLTDLISCSTRDSRIFSNTTIENPQFFHSPLFCSAAPTSVHDYWKDHSFVSVDLCWQSNICFLKCCLGWSSLFKELVSFNFMAVVTICCDFGAQENKGSHCFHCFPVCLPWNEETGCHDLLFLNVEFSFSSFPFIKRLFRSSLLFALWVVSSAYVRLLTFLLLVVISACVSSSPAFCMTYCAYVTYSYIDRMRIHGFDVLLSQFWTSLLFHVWF